MEGKIFKQKNRSYALPLFKFLNSEHAKVFLEKGNIHLTNIKEFRNGTYGGKIDDPREGQVSLLYPHREDINQNIALKKESISIDNVFIYCVSRSFLSDTLKLAIEDGKTSCVLITDEKEFMQRISNISNELNFIGVNDCIYSGRDIDYRLRPIKLTAGIINNSIIAAWIKPAEYKDQREVRYIWKQKKEHFGEKHINHNINLSNLLIPVHFEGMEKIFNTPNNHIIVATLVTNSRLGNTSYQMQYPYNVFTPIIYKTDESNEFLIGFKPPSNVISNGVLAGGRVDNILGIGIILNGVYLKDVVEIRYAVKKII